MQKMPWKENTQPHLSENIGSEQRGDRAVRVGRGELWGGGGWGLGKGWASRSFHSPSSDRAGPEALRGGSRLSVPSPCWAASAGPRRSPGAGRGGGRSPFCPALISRGCTHRNRGGRGGTPTLSPLARAAALPSFSAPGERTRQAMRELSLPTLPDIALTERADSVRQHRLPKGDPEAREDTWLSVPSRWPQAEAGVIATPLRG